MFARIARHLVAGAPSLTQLAAAALVFTAGTLMGSELIAPNIGVELGDVDRARAAYGAVGALLFIARVRVYARGAQDAPSDPTRELEIVGTALLVLEAVVFTQVGDVALFAWALAAGWSALVRRSIFAPIHLVTRGALHVVVHMLLGGLTFGMLLAIGIDAHTDAVTVGAFFDSVYTWLAMLAATCLAIGVEWGRCFRALQQRHGELGWSLWMLWPSAGALGFTALIRETYPTWSAAALAAVGMTTIAGHALVMGQRVRPGADTGRPDQPSGALEHVTQVLPAVTGVLVMLVLAVAGVVEFAT